MMFLHISVVTSLKWTGFPQCSHSCDVSLRVKKTKLWYCNYLEQLLFLFFCFALNNFKLWQVFVFHWFNTKSIHDNGWILWDTEACFKKAKHKKTRSPIGYRQIKANHVATSQFVSFTPVLNIFFMSHVNICLWRSPWSCVYYLKTINVGRG